MSKTEPEPPGLQQFIYDMNSCELRSEIMKRCLSRYDRDKQRYVWLGTVRLLESDRGGRNDAKMQKLLSRTDGHRTCLMTLSYTYEGNKIHYISVMYSPVENKVILFDPGFNMYNVGKDVLIPLVKSTFKGMSGKILFFKKTACQKSRYGIQLNKTYATMVVPDAFCQSWTLFFLQCFVRYGQDVTFFRTWCKLKTGFRDLYLMREFILPAVSYSTRLSRKYAEMVEDVERVLLTRVWKLKD